MLSELIQHIENGMLFYVKQVEGTHYQGGDTFSLDYIATSPYIASSRKKHMEGVVKLCRNAILRQNSARELARDIVDYAETFPNLFYRIMGITPRLQKAIIQAIAQYYPTLVQWDGKQAIVNNDALPFKPSQSQTLPTIEINANQQLIHQNELLQQLQTTNIALQSQLAKQQELIEKLSDDLEQAKLEIIELRNTKNTTDNEPEFDYHDPAAVPLLSENAKRLEVR